MSKTHSCFNCGAEGFDMFGYSICESCKSNLGLFTDETIARHIADFKEETGKLSYQDEIERRIEFIEKDFIKKKLKLQYILEKIKEIG